MAGVETNLKGLIKDEALADPQYQIIVLFDKHGTYEEPWIGPVNHHTRPLTDDHIRQLNDIENFGGLIDRNIEIVKCWPKKDKFSAPSLKEIWESIWKERRYRVRPDQERGLVAIAQNELASCTLLSAMGAEHKDRVKQGLGDSGRASLDPNRLMILGKGKHPMFSKMVGVGAVVYGFDLPVEARLNMPKRIIFLVDDDPNFLEAAGRYYGLPCLAPITGEQRKKYPALPLPERLQGKKAHVLYNAGLPELHGILRGISKAQLVSPYRAAELVMEEFSDSSHRPTLPCIIPIKH